MHEMGDKTFQNDLAEPCATAIYRVIDGEPQIVFVCEACEDIHTITVGAAMRNALSSYAGRHRSQRHPPSLEPAAQPEDAPS